MFSFPVTEKLIFREHCKQNIRSFTLFFISLSQKPCPSLESAFAAFFDQFNDAILAFYNATSDNYVCN